MDTKEFEFALHDLETRIDRLRALYENWFRGYEKTEPQVARKDVERRVYGLRKEMPRNTALRFRYHQLYQRYTTLANYWQRTAKQIEEGTYRLQLQRMRRRTGGVGLPRNPDDALEELDTKRPPPKSYALDLDESLDVDDLLEELESDEKAAQDSAGGGRMHALRPAPMEPAQSGVVGSPRPAPPPPVMRPSPTALVAPAKVASSEKRPSLPPLSSGMRLGTKSGPPTGLRPMPAPPSTGTTGLLGRPAPKPVANGVANAAPSEQRLKHLYDEYAAARRRNNEGEIRYENLVASIKKVLPDLQNKHQGKQIDFDVVVKDGRVGLKPRVRAP